VAWAAAQTVLPQAQELWAVFLSGGLIGVVLYQLWTMLMTSFLGVLVTWHAGFVLAEQFLKFDAAKWVEQHAAALNGGVISVAVIGVLVQVKTTPRPTADAEEEPDAHEDGKPKNAKAKQAEEPEPKPRGWWHRRSHAA
jgi:hypothetical protein